jgi:hypothetical protein
MTSEERALKSPARRVNRPEGIREEEEDSMKSKKGGV